MKPGRNDPCSCGSGKKYKHCCLAASSNASESPQELTWRRLRRALEGFPSTMLAYVENVYGAEIVEEAWDEFVLWDDDADMFDPESPHMQVFTPWFFHHWTPDTDGSFVRDTSLLGRSPTRVFLDRKSSKLDPLLRRYLEACIDTPFSFYEILHVERGRGMRVQDIFTGEEKEVLERAASMSMQRGDLLYSMLVQADGVTLLEACQPCVIPPIEKLRLMDLRRELKNVKGKPAEESSWEREYALRAAYLDITGSILNPVMPELRNTDDETLVPQQLVFDIDSPEAAFDALSHLAFGETPDALLEDAERSENGALQRIDFDWRKPGNSKHASWTNTVLGSISIVGQRLTADVNSNERAATFRDIVEKALGEKARYRATKIESLERAFGDQTADEWAHRQSGPSPEEASLMESPELKAQLQEMLEAHYNNWINDEIPALDNRTPLAAVRDPDGRERVEALVQQMERTIAMQGSSAGSGIIERLRERLGLQR